MCTFKIERAKLYTRKRASESVSEREPECIVLNEYIKRFGFVEYIKEARFLYTP